jgi:hypothetical protein
LSLNGEADIVPRPAITSVEAWSSTEHIVASAAIERVVPGVAMQGVREITPGAVPCEPAVKLVSTVSTPKDVAARAS